MKVRTMLQPAERSGCSERTSLRKNKIKRVTVETEVLLIRHNGSICDSRLLNVADDKSAASYGAVPLQAMSKRSVHEALVCQLGRHSDRCLAKPNEAIHITRSRLKAPCLSGSTPVCQWRSVTYCTCTKSPTPH